MLPVRRVFASLLLALLAACLAPALPAAAQGAREGLASPRDDEPILHAFTFKHQRASDAVALVHPLLSPRGTVELQPGDNTLVIRDNAAALAKILPLLRAFDHASRPIRLEVMIVRASRAVVSPAVTHSDLPEELTRRLHDLLGYDTFDLEAQVQLKTLEGEAVTYELGEEYRLGFRLGTVLPSRRIRLTDFEVTRRSGKKAGRQLIHTNLNLWMDQTMSLGLARSEESREALMVVLTVRDAEAARHP